MNTVKKPFFPALTGLRAIAAYMVFFDHNPLPIRRFGHLINDICQQLFIGVSFFFVLSGFLITIRYEDQIRNTKHWALGYIKNRFARIYPMYFLITTFTFWFYIYHLHDLHTQVIKYNPFFVYMSNITFARGFFDDLLLTGISQGWTLTVEECFYALAPIIFLLSTKYKLRFQVIVIYILGILLWLFFRSVRFYGLFGSLPFVFGRTFFGRCVDLYIGVALARLYKRKGNFPIIRKHFTIIGSLLVTATVALFILTKGNYEHVIYSPQGILINNFILPFAIAVLFWGLLHESTLLNRLLSTKAFSLLGKSSYTFYLIHLGVFSELLYHHVTNNYLLNFPLLVILSIVLYKLIEEPLNKSIKGKEKA